jgi:hypothetical protein
LSETLVDVFITAYEIERRTSFFFRSSRAREDPGARLHARRRRPRDRGRADVLRARARPRRRRLGGLQLAQLLPAGPDVRLQTRLDEGGDDLDDAGDRNLEALRRAGARLVEARSADLDRIAAELTRADS